MTGISISLASGKGGVGKSTICANLGIALCQLDIKTLVVDADLEGASISMIFGANFTGPTLHDYLSGKIIDSRDTICKIPAEISKQDVELVMGSIRVDTLAEVNLEAFKRLIDSLTEKYDILLVDAPSGLGIDVITALSSTDAVLIIVTPDVLSVTNALKLKVVSERMKKNILGVIINRSGSEYDIPSNYIEEMIDVKVIGVVEEDEAVKKALKEGKPLLFHSPNSKAADSIKKVALSLIGKEESKK